MSLEDRVGQVEQVVARQGAKLEAIEGYVHKIGRGVETLLERDAKRPAAVTFQTVAITCAALASIAGVVWWLIGTSPAVTDLRDRVNRLDDPIVGRVPRIEQELERSGGWQTTKIVRGR